ncbi:MAG: hypothetical protein IH588_08205 [Anaerolineales bacterium]|nr:hypothetical protein [Anaerolineales bacterium]
MESQRKNLGAITKNSLLIAWSLLCTSLFIVFPGRVNYMQWVAIGNPLLLIEKITEIPFLPYAVNLFYSLGMITLYFFCSISLGTFVTRHIQLAPNDQGDFYTKCALAATQFLIGQALFSLIFLMIAARYDLSPLSVAIILLSGSLLGVAGIRKTISTLGKPDKLGGLSKVVTILSSFVIVITVLQSSSRISYDSTAIYFSDAKLTAINQKASFFTNDTFVASVLQSTIQYSTIIQIFGEQAARMLSWGCGVAIAIFSLALGKKTGLSKSATAILLALIASSTAFLDLMGDGKVDLISGAFAISAVYWMSTENRDQDPSKIRLILIGFLAGFSCILRPFNVFLMSILILSFYFQNITLKDKINSSNTKPLVTTLSWIAVGAIGPGIYHLVLNWVLFGNPLAFISSMTNINPSTGPWDYDPNTILLSRILYPFVVTFKNNPQSLGNISPLFVAFLPAVLMKNVRSKLVFPGILKPLILAAIFTLTLWIFSFFTIIEIRYVFFLWIIIYIPMAEIIAMALRDENQLMKNTTGGLLVITLSFMILRSVNISFSAYSYIDASGTPQCSNTPFCEYLKPINNLAHQGDRILTLGAYRYYLRPDLFACSTNHNEYALLQELSHSDMDAFWHEVYRQGYKFIAYEKDYTVRHLQFGSIPGPENTPPWMHLEPLYDQAADELISYEIQVKNPPIETEILCEQNLNGIWGLKNK